MSETITRLVVDLSKPEGHPERVQSIPLTAEELSERKIMAAQAEVEQIAREAQEAAKAEAKESAIAKLSALGLTESEITALIS
jgi:F0F1-type ATP synthase membrane subunit b/b'